MSDPISLQMESSVLAQCLEFSKQMDSNQKTFKLEVKLSSGFSFNFNTLDKEEPKSRTVEVKKKSPSTLRRNADRRQKFLEKKNVYSANKELSETFKCDQCEYEVNCKVNLRKHIGRKHRVIPQLDGATDLKPSEDTSSQTDHITIKHSEVQTESSDGHVTVKWGESDLTPPPGTVILIYKPECLEVDYPVMSAVAPWVFHPKWGLGNMKMKTKNISSRDSMKKRFILEGGSFNFLHPALLRAEVPPTKSSLYISGQDSHLFTNQHLMFD